MHVHHHIHYYEEDIIKSLNDYQYNEKYEKYMAKEKIPYFPESNESIDRWMDKKNLEAQNPNWKSAMEGKKASVVSHVTKHIGFKKKWTERQKWELDFSVNSRLTSFHYAENFIIWK